MYVIRGCVSFDFHFQNVNANHEKKTMQKYDFVILELAVSLFLLH